MRKSIRASVAIDREIQARRDDLQGLQRVQALSALASHSPLHAELATWLHDFFSISASILRCRQIIFGPSKTPSPWPWYSAGEELLPPSLVQEFISEMRATPRQYGVSLKLGQKYGKAMLRRWPAIAQTVMQVLHCGAFCAVVMPPRVQVDGNLFAVVGTLLDGALLGALGSTAQAPPPAGLQPEPPERAELLAFEDSPGILICDDRLQPVFANEAMLRLIAARSASFDNPALAGLHPLIQKQWERRQPRQIVFDLQTQISLGGPGYAIIVPIRLDEAEFAMMIFHRGAPPAAVQQELASATMHAALSELARGMMHEINNPATSILNYAKLLQMKNISSAEVQEFAGAITAEVERIASLARNLQFSAGRDATKLQHTSINQLVSTVLSLHKTRFSHEHIILEDHYDNAAPEVLCWPEQIAAALTHLIHNARLSLNARFAEDDENKVLRVSTSCLRETTNTFAEVIITDNGLGIAPGLASMIFKPFFSAWPNDRRAGMGLFVARTIARAHHGDLVLHQAPKPPTTFALRLPAA
jgi:nitrogen-specific signal transduction histidine kinase